MYRNVYMYIFLKWTEITSKVDRNYLKSGPKLPGPSLPGPILLVFVENSIRNVSKKVNQ